MLLPTKITPYNESIIANFPILLETLEESSYMPKMLYDKLKPHFDSIGTYVEALDCLYALGKIILDERGVLHIVKNVTL